MTVRRSATELLRRGSLGREGGVSGLVVTQSHSDSNISISIFRPLVLSLLILSFLFEPAHNATAPPELGDHIYLMS